MKIEAKERRLSESSFFLEVLLYGLTFKNSRFYAHGKMRRRKNVIPTFGGKLVHSFLRPYELDDFISPVLWEKCYFTFLE